MSRPAVFLPASEHVAYLANLLTLLAILYGAWTVWKHERAEANGETTPSGWRFR